MYEDINVIFKEVPKVISSWLEWPNNGWFSLLILVKKKKKENEKVEIFYILL